MAGPARFAGNDVHLGRISPARALLLQALHQGATMWRHLHQHEEDVQNAAGVRMLVAIRGLARRSLLSGSVIIKQAR